MEHRLTLKEITQLLRKEFFLSKDPEGETLDSVAELGAHAATEKYRHPYRAVEHAEAREKLKARIEEYNEVCLIMDTQRTFRMFVEINKITVAHLADELNSLHKLLHDELSPMRRQEVRNRVRVLRDMLEEITHTGFKEHEDE